MTRIKKVEEHENALELRKQGWPVKAIAREVGVHHDTVRKWVLGLPRIRHHLLSVNLDSRTGVCELCGPTDIRKNGPNKWQCGTMVRRISDENITRSLRVFYDYLCAQSCVDCGNSNPIVLEFDHVRDSKSYNVSDMVRKGYKWDTIQKEIDKCEVVCANCHRIRTNDRGLFYRHVYAGDS